MGSRKKLRELYEAESKHGAFYTGGALHWTADGNTLLTKCNGTINVFDVIQGKVTSVLNKPDEDIDSDGDEILTFALSSDDEKIVTIHRSGLFKLWQWKNGTIERTWKSVHKGPVASIAFDKTGGLVVSGGTDSGVRLWDLPRRTCMASLRGAQGVVSIVCFHPSDEVPLVFGAADDTTIWGWNVNTGKAEVSLTGHFSKVTSIVFHEDNKHIVSCARDKVMILWHMQKNEPVRTLPAYEGLEGLVLLPEKFHLPDREKPVKGSIHVATAGEKGIIRIWNMVAGREVYVQTNSLVSKAAEDGGLSITNLLFNQIKNWFGVVTADHNIILHDLESFRCEKQLVGFSDDILDIALVGQNNSHLAVATNSIDIKLYDMAEMGCQLLKGHTDFVLALATSPSNPNLLLSSGKDKSVRAWLMSDELKTVRLVGEGCRHTASVGSMAISCISASFFLSASQDMCVKLWTLPNNFPKGSTEQLVATHTQLAHDKDINCVCVSPNDKMAATASQDKTAKLWSTDGLALVGILRGHKRGVWCVRFSPIDQVVLTSSADCSLRMWSVTDLSCLKTLEGHESSVLRAEFITQGMQIVSVGGDGLMKVWAIKTSECLATLDEHSGKIWALVVREDGNGLVTGGSDSLLVRWGDVTEQRRAEQQQAQEQTLQQEQELANLLHEEKLLQALKLALRLDRPLHVLRIIQDVIKKGDSGLECTIRELSVDQKESLLKCAVNWNTNSRNCHPAQLVIRILLDDLAVGSLKPADYTALLEGALPYTERHFQRLTRLLQDLHLIKYTRACMQPHAAKSMDDT